MMKVYYNEHLKKNRQARRISSIECEIFHSIIATSYQNLAERGYQLNIDCIMILKLLIL